MRVANRIPEWWQTALLALALFLLNGYICRELFGIEYLFNMGTIECVYFGIDRWALAHWPDLRWFPLWYDGIPFQNTYPPLLQACVVLLVKLTGFSVPHAHHFVIALAYCLGPVAVFALAIRFSGSRWAGFAAGLVYSCVSMSAWLIPAIAKDLGSHWHARRLQALVVYGESPHIVALTLLPLAVLFLDLALERRRAPYILLAVLGIAGTVLTNWLAAFALALAIAAYMLARFGGPDWRWTDVAWLLAIAAAAYALAMPWIPPSTIATTRMNARDAGGDFASVYGALPVRAAIAAAALLALKFVLRKLPGYLQFGMFFAALAAALPLGEAWFGVAIVPQPARYHFEMEMGLALAFGFAGVAILNNRQRSVAMAILLIALAYPVRDYRQYSKRFLMRSIDITQTIEWRTAQWLNQNWTGGRVMLLGDSSFWLPAFSDVPQLAGGYDQGVTNYTIRVAMYELYSDALAGEHAVGEFVALAESARRGGGWCERRCEPGCASEEIRRSDRGAVAGRRQRHLSRGQWQRVAGAGGADDECREKRADKRDRPRWSAAVRCGSGRSENAAGGVSLDLRAFGADRGGFAAGASDFGANVVGSGMACGGEWP